MGPSAPRTEGRRGASTLKPCPPLPAGAALLILPPPIDLNGPGRVPAPMAAAAAPAPHCPRCGHLESDHLGGRCLRLLHRQGMRQFPCPCGTAKPDGKLWPLYARAALANGADPRTLPARLRITASAGGGKDR